MIDIKIIMCISVNFSSVFVHMKNVSIFLQVKYMLRGSDGGPYEPRHYVERV